MNSGVATTQVAFQPEGYVGAFPQQTGAQELETNILRQGDSRVDMDYEDHSEARPTNSGEAAGVGEYSG